MSPTRTLLVTVPVCAAWLLACSSERMPPKTLVDAQNELARAKGGIAMQLDPTDVHEAELALQKAEHAWSEDPDEPNTTDLAIIAQRKSQIAQAEAAAMKAQQDAANAKKEQEALMASQLVATRGALDKTKQSLERQSAEKAALEMKLREAHDTIAKIAAVKDDDRGMVITLQGEVLFKTGKWDLKAAAMAKLDQIAEALRGKEQPMVVLGFTDNVGNRDNNMDLSMKRATAVRDYLVGRGIPSDLITAQGKGPDDPVSDNSSVDGRAANRRVEIVVKPKSG